MIILIYSYNEQEIQIQETPNGDDYEIVIQILTQEEHYLEGIKKVRKFFEDDEVHTDVLFYAYENNRYQMIVRQDYYVTFILELMKHRILQSLEWKN